jgi:hypothetical protein
MFGADAAGMLQADPRLPVGNLLVLHDLGTLIDSQSERFSRNPIATHLMAMLSCLHVRVLLGEALRGHGMGESMQTLQSSVSN